MMRVSAASMRSSIIMGRCSMSRSAGAISSRCRTIARRGRRRRKPGSQAELDAWLKSHPRGVTGDDGLTYFPETDLNRIHARIKRMPPRERKSFAADVRYVLEAT